MYATVLRPCSSKALFMLSLFEAPASGRPGESAGDVSLGFPDGCSFAFKDALMLTRADLGDLLEVDADKLAEWPLDGGGIDALTRQRVLRCARIFALALQVLEDRRVAAAWLKSPQAQLEGEVPLRLVRTETGARAVERALRRYLRKTAGAAGPGPYPR